MNPRIYEPLEYLQIIDPQTIIRPAKLQLVSNFSGSVSESIATRFKAWLADQGYDVHIDPENRFGPGTIFLKDQKSIYVGDVVDDKAYVAITH